MYRTSETGVQHFSRYCELMHASLNINNNNLNIPFDVCYIKTECKPLVVQVLRCGCENHAKYRVAASTKQIHDQTAEGNLQPKSDSGTDLIQQVVIHA